MLTATGALAYRETTKDRIARIISEFAEQGIHRFGAAGDLEKTGRWVVSFTEIAVKLSQSTD
jgi:hypothetical protein